MAGEEGGLATAAEAQSSVKEIAVAAAADEELGCGGAVDVTPGTAEVGAAGAAVGGLGLGEWRGEAEEGEDEKARGAVEEVHGARALGGEAGGRKVTREGGNSGGQPRTGAWTRVLEGAAWRWRPVGARTPKRDLTLS